jgi:hypothetical protein
MLETPDGPLVHILFVLMLIARVGDIGTTYLITPSLALEANPIIRRLGWRYAVLTIALCAVPYFSVPLAVTILIPFLFLSGSNASKVWAVRTMGEEAYLQWVLALARQSKLSHALLGVAASAFFVVLAGAVIFLFYPSPDEWGFWIALGIVIYGALVLGLFGTLSTRRMFRRAHIAQPPAISPPS